MCHDLCNNRVEPTTNIGEVPDFAKERLRKALGHINATERKLWHDTDRGLWSAKQTKAQVAEAWLWLEDGTEFPPIERHLAREVVQARLEAFEKAPMSDAVRAAWAEVGTAEQAILKAEFPLLTPSFQYIDTSTLWTGERQGSDSFPVRHPRPH